MKRITKSLGATAVGALVVGGLYVATQARAAQPSLTPAETLLVQKIMSTQVGAAGAVKVAKVKGAEVVDAYTPGEQPWGDDTPKYRADDFLAVAIPDALTRPAVLSVPSGYTGPTVVKPTGVIVFIDVQKGEQVGGISVTTTASLAQVSLGKLAGAPIVDVTVSPGK